MTWKFKMWFEVGKYGSVAFRTTGALDSQNCRFRLQYIGPLQRFFLPVEIPTTETYITGVWRLAADESSTGVRRAQAWEALLPNNTSQACTRTLHPYPKN